VTLPFSPDTHVRLLSPASRLPFQVCQVDRKRATQVFSPGHLVWARTALPAQLAATVLSPISLRRRRVDDGFLPCESTGWQPKS